MGGVKHFLTGGGRRFKKEFRRQLRTLILFTLGFTIAFTWRETIYRLFESFIKILTHSQNSAALTILTSTLITLVSIGIIYLTSYYLRDNLDNY